MRGWTLAVAVLAGGSIAANGRAEDLPHHRPPAPRHAGTVVELCDGETSVEVAASGSGTRLSRRKAQAVADELMARWKAKHPRARWELASAGATPGEPRVASPPPSGPTSQAGVYVDTDSRDEFIRAQALAAVVEEGNRIFHDDRLLGGTIGVSCDMCHPNAANTHPETYPKYQVQLQRVALLRDMINWCIENPVRGTPLRDDDPKLKALEAYILSQRVGVPLAYGRH